MTKLIRDEKGMLPAFAWPGGYSIRYLMADGESICAACANNERASENADDKDWRLVAYYVHWEGPDETCAHCGNTMPSEYGDPDEEKAIANE